MRKKNEPIHYNKGLAKIFAIADELEEYPSSKQFPDCDHIPPTPTMMLTHCCFHMVNGVGVIQFCKRGCSLKIELSSQDKRWIRQRRLRLGIIAVDVELEHIARLYPDTRQTIDRTRDLLGSYSHELCGVNITEFCGNPENHTTRRMEEVAV